MKENMMHTPDGVKDYLPEDYRIKREVENRIEAVLNRRGYQSMSPPTFEYIDVFSGIGSVDEGRIYKFIDRDGSVLALRSDITPQISRIAASNNWGGSYPLRFCYVANVYRYNESLQGKPNEFTQAGAEIYGACEGDADAEIIAAAINSLICAGLADFRIDIGHVEFLCGILSETGLNETELGEIQTNILKRDFVAVANAVKGREMPEGAKQILSDLALYIGDIHMLEKCAGIVTSEMAKNALKKLTNVYETLRQMKLDKYVLFDLSLTGNLDYYTGIIFKGYTYGAAFSIVDGGRYDKLSENFGKKIESVGFAITINDLVTSLKESRVVFDLPVADTLAAYTEGGRETAFLCADALRGEGLYVENSLCGSDIEQNLKYAAEKNFSGMIYFADGGKIMLYNLKTGEMAEVTLNNLLGGTKEEKL
ncbi:MAG: ATP phosphoribosyltransferase regulatory subunit [Clostridiales bacterium]|jgi:ATP phosphoribosyltransferase regulatory subunit|nr:ATP phosphoribosyltransferase regulatory subunit [Clostridiales bacterium]